MSGRSAPVRTCVASRQQAGPDELVRLVQDLDGRVLVDYRGKLGGRGAWVTPRRQEVELLEKKPRILSRAFKGAINSAGLLDRMRDANGKAVDFGLSVAARSGALAGGKEQVRAALAGGQGLALILAFDTSERLKDDLRGRARAVSGDSLFVIELAMDRDTLGAKVGKGPGLRWL